VASWKCTSPTALWWPSGFARGNKTRRTTSETMRPVARGDTRVGHELT
jgi:hypothetical protein